MAREPIARSQADSAVDPTLAQKKRARHRLVGAIALCLLAALLIPLVLESEPRQPPRDIPLEIDPRSQPVPAQPQPGLAAATPSTDGTSGSGGTAAGTGGQVAAPEPARSTVQPVEAGSATGSGAGARGASRAEARPPDARPETGQEARQEARNEPRPVARAEPRPETRPDARPENRPENRPAPKAEQKTEQKAEPKAAPKADAKAPPKAEARPVPSGDPLAGIINRTDPQRRQAAAPSGRRFLVQVGAYSSAQRARDVSERVAQAGLKPYQETVKVDSGSVTRVRIGPFENREAAERAMRSLKAAGVTAALVAL